jgi:NAD(P)-dependent dehydrogenase (short-subunit alcohol dehydrogenase family)
MFGNQEYYDNGIEKTFMTNYLGPWYLTQIMLNILAKTSINDQCEVRIIVVGSRSEKYSNLKDTFPISKNRAILDLFKGPTKYEVWPSYSNSKLGNMLMTYELARRFEAAKHKPTLWSTLLHSPYIPSHFYCPLSPTTTTTTTTSYPKIAINAMTPGITNTDLPRHLSPFMAYLTYPLRTLFLKSAADGGSEIVYAASQSDGTSGKYFGEHQEVQSSSHAKSEELGKAMWEETEIILQHLIAKGHIDGLFGNK